MKSHPRTLIIFFSVFVLSTGFCLFYFSQESHTEDKAPAPERPALTVTVIQARADAYPVSLTLFGQAAPNHEADLRPSVSGRLTWVSPDLEPGATLVKGQVLARVEQSPYQSKLARAELELDTARVALLKEEQEAADALRGWQNSGLAGEPDSGLVLRQPQLQAAEARVRAAAADLAAARTELTDCSITASFDCLVVSAQASPGQMVSSADTLARIMSVDKAEIAVSLDQAQWELIAPELSQVRATLLDDTGTQIWEAAIVRKGMHILPQSRLRQLFLEVNRPLDQSPPLLPGTFLRVRLTAPERQNLISLPESCVTGQGLVWFATADKTLDHFRAAPLFSREGRVFLRPPEGIALPLPVARYPNTAFARGKTITLKPMKDKG